MGSAIQKDLWNMGSNLYIIHWDLRRNVYTGCMARPLRIHLPGAFYYITATVLKEAGFLLMYNVKI
jgi:hypothetical protein